jgi:plasmid stabilization system protein ParE
MPRPGWSAKRERQYEHIRDGLLGRGMSQGKAQEIAARTVNKERARTGEATTSRPSSTHPTSGSRGS